MSSSIRSRLVCVVPRNNGPSAAPIGIAVQAPSLLLKSLAGWKPAPQKSLAGWKPAPQKSLAGSQPPPEEPGRLEACTTEEPGRLEACTTEEETKQAELFQDRSRERIPMGFQPF